jgi:hypothetical protein
VKYSKPGVNQFAFNPAKGPGYVWHCHIIDHEDNDMMRPYTLEGGCGDSTLVIAKSEGGLPNTPGYLNQNIVAGFNVKGSTLLYGVPSESNIVIRLFTPTGKLVSTLKSGFHKRGYYEVALPIGKSLSHSRYILEYKAATGRMLKIL